MQRVPGREERRKVEASAPSLLCDGIGEEVEGWRGKAART